MKDTLRASLRRHHKERMRVKARQLWIDIYKAGPEQAEEFARKNADHLKSCSCNMCGHKRRNLGKTLQELKHEYDHMD